MMGLLDYAVPPVGVLLVLGLPIYLAWFIYRSLGAKKTGKPGPSRLYLAIYLCLLVSVIFFLELFGNFFGSRQGEAKVNLNQIFNEQVNYYVEHNQYASGPHALTALGFKPFPARWEGPDSVRILLDTIGIHPAGKRRYAFACGDDFIPNTSDPPIPRAAIPAGIVGVNPDSFTCMAIGNIDDDPDLDYWTINDAKMIENLPSTDL